MSHPEINTERGIFGVWRRKKGKLAWMIALTLSGLEAASIASADEVETEVKTLEAVTITSHYDNAVGTSDAASQGTVTSELIANRPTLRSGEVMEFVPGMIVSQHSGDGKANQYYLRGFNLDHGTDFATSADGVPLNMRTHAHGQGYTDLNFLVPELLDRIDYKKGPYFADEGDFASAGAAHLRLKDRLPAGIASLSVGQHGYQRGLLADSVSALDGTLLYALDVQHNNGPWTNPENVRKYSTVLRYSSGTQADGFNITAMAYRNRWDSTDQIPLRAVQSGQIGRFDAIDASDGGNASRYSLSYEMRRSGQDSRFEMNAYAVKSSLNLFSNFTYFMNDPLQGDQFRQAESRKMFGLNMTQTWFGKLGSLDTLNRIGVQARSDLISPVGLYGTANRQPVSMTREDRVRQGSIGLWVDNSTQWLPKLRTVAGARFDVYRFNVDSSAASNSGSANAHITSPKLSVIFGPWSQTEYFLNFGKGFHSNDARGVTQTRLPNDAGLSAAVTPLVSTRGWEAGARSEIIPGLQSSLSYWALDIDSELVFAGDAGSTEASRPSKRHGIEWNNHYVVNKWLMIDFDLAASHARYSQGAPQDRYIPGAIGKVVSLGLTVTGIGPWFGAFQLRYFGPRPLVEDNSVRSHSTTLASARVGYRINPKTTLTLDVFNLFNRAVSDIDYYYASQLRGEAAPVGDIHFHPVEPRTLRLTLTRRFD
jgi:outer membrane cobalamin receptor